MLESRDILTTDDFEPKSLAPTSPTSPTSPVVVRLYEWAPHAVKEGRDAPPQGSTRLRVVLNHFLRDAYLLLSHILDSVPIYFRLSSLYLLTDCRTS